MGMDVVKNGNHFYIVDFSEIVQPLLSESSPHPFILCYFHIPLSIFFSLSLSRNAYLRRFVEEAVGFSSSSLKMGTLGNGGRSLMNSSGNVSVRNNGGGAFGHQHSVRTRAAVSGSRRSVTPTSRASRSLPLDSDPESERVRVAVRLRPRNPMDPSDLDYADCVELQPELKRLKLRKNNWSSESYKFDEIFTETASQKRVYEAVAKPVVESVLDGYNGTVMAYGQTGTGKTYTLGRLGKDDASERGIMVRALEDILASSSESDSVEVSYLQLYMESIQDLLAPEKTSIPFVEDARTGEVSVPNAELVKIRNIDHFIHILQLGEANRYAANTKMNTESSRSHAILMVHIRRSTHDKEEIDTNHLPTIRKSKLLIVDLAGSERLEKSGSEGHLIKEAKFINLSLTSLGKCINALAENSPHIPTRDSKLTRLLRDSFGGSARTSLIITIGPSSLHHAETASTVMFGQRAMKVVNTVKVKEEFDYESLCRKLEAQVDHLSAEIDRQQKSRENDKMEMQKFLEESKAKAEARLVVRSESLEKENARLTLIVKDLLQELDSHKQQNKSLLDEIARLEIIITNSKQQQLENSSYKKILDDTARIYEEKIADLMKQMEDEKVRSSNAEEEMKKMKEQLADVQATLQINSKKEIDELRMRLQEMHCLHETTANELRLLRIEYKNIESEKAELKNELSAVRQTLQVEERRRKEAEKELLNIMKVPESEDGFEEKVSYMHENKTKTVSNFHNMQNSHKSSRSRETILSQRNTIAKICEEVGIQKILSLLESEDLDVQIHAVKVVANLAAEDINQERIVQEGGLDALLKLLESSHNTTILRVASGAIANLAMNEMNQGLITKKGGAKLLANAAYKTDDSQTLRMVAGAIANLCGNENLHFVLKEDEAISALLKMTSYGNADVIAQVARGFANFAKCESRKIMQGHWRGRSLLMEAGGLSWLVSNLNTSSPSTRRHIELAICHLAQNEANGRDFIINGGHKELIEISDESTREDIRNLAKKTLRLSPLFQRELHAQ